METKPMRRSSRAVHSASRLFLQAKAKIPIREALSERRAAHHNCWIRPSVLPNVSNPLSS